MFMWLIKQLLTIRKALDGRNHPHQLAWGLSLGFLVGVVPHGNLLAVGLIILVLSLRINHSMFAVTGVAVALLAANLDPVTDRLGRWILTDSRWHEALMTAWQWPLIPWTDLNNTIVIGSFSLGLAMVLPLYAVSYPIFRYLRPAVEEKADVAGSAEESPADERLPNPQVRCRQDQPHALAGHHQPVWPFEAAPRRDPFGLTEPTPSHAKPSLDEAPIEFIPLDPSTTSDGEGAPPNAPADSLNEQDASPEQRIDQSHEELVAMETQIDVIRLSDDEDQAAEADEAAPDEVPMNQALGYLLRRLRDSQQGDAA